MTPPLAELDEAELRRLARIAGRLFAGRPKLMPGNRPHRLRAGAGIEFLDHREYRPGDNLRDVDWLATARSGRPQVRRFRDETSADWIICLDCSASMGIGSGEKWRLAVQLAAALAYLLIHLDNRVGVILFREHIVSLKPLGRGQHAYAGMLRLLEGIAPEPSGGGSRPGVCTTHIQPGCQIIVISDFLAEEGMQADLARMARIGEAVHAIQILSPDETRVDGEGVVCLQDIENGDQVTVDLSRECLREVEERLERFRRQLMSHCRKYHIGFSYCDATESWRDVLMKHMKQLGTASA